MASIREDLFINAVVVVFVTFYQEINILVINYWHGCVYSLNSS